MNFIKDCISAVCIMFLVFFVLLSAPVVFAFVAYGLEDISRRCRCPTINSDEDFRQFALEKMLQYGDARVIYQQNLAVDPDYKINGFIGARTWSYTYWSFIRFGDFRIMELPDHSQKRYTRSFTFEITADECGRVLNVETMGS